MYSEISATVVMIAPCFVCVAVAVERGVFFVFSCYISSMPLSVHHAIELWIIGVKYIGKKVA